MVMCLAIGLVPNTMAAANRQLDQAFETHLVSASAPAEAGVTEARTALVIQGQADAAEAAAEEAARQEAARQEAARQAAAAAAAAAATQAQPPAQRPAPVIPPDRAAVADIIRQVFSEYGPAAVEWGLRVAACESGYNPNAYNAAGPYYGLFQFLESTFRNTPYGNQNIYDPWYNARAAAWKYSVSGPGAWGCR
jgi:hypothetical protein